jgi:hypothetical protein
MTDFFLFRCTLYGKAVDSDAPIASVDQNKLLEEMRVSCLFHSPHIVHFPAFDKAADPEV